MNSPRRLSVLMLTVGFIVRRLNHYLPSDYLPVCLPYPLGLSCTHKLPSDYLPRMSTLQNLILTDADGQGMLCMGKEQLPEFRDKPLAASASANRTQVPALNMKLWYAPYLELPEGGGMEGATLVSIRPSDRLIKKDTEAFLAGAFDEPFGVAAKEMVKKRTYLLEMNSF